MMKVVLFCGGMGTRLRASSESTPKPMINIGYRPLLWHVMKYYAHFGHRDFVLCLGYRADVVKNYFRSYDECLSNDFVMSGGGQQIELLGSDIHDWRITFVDTGIATSIGERLKAVEPHLEGEEVFLANYSDGLADLDLNSYLDDVVPRGRVGNFLCVRSTQSFHVVDVDDDGSVRRIRPVADSDTWLNGGFFVFRREIFDYLHPGEDLVDGAFERLRQEGQLFGFKHNGFWKAMDTFKDKEALENMYASGEAPWEVWKSKGGNGHRLAMKPALVRVETS
jgi:glucose-1-phosphate cytidylyltransferase